MLINWDTASAGPLKFRLLSGDLFFIGTEDSKTISAPAEYLQNNKDIV
jgi:hypothetical protein